MLRLRHGIAQRKPVRQMEFANHGEGLSLCIDAHQSVLDNIIQAGNRRRSRDYPGAEQAVMAIDLLLIDANLAANTRRNAMKYIAAE